jgi:hypothetical protein
MNQPSMPPAWVIWLIIAVICLPAVYTYILRPAAYRLRRRDSSSWPTTTTKTLSATVRKIGRGEGPWEVTLVYSYRADDEYQSGEEKKLFSEQPDASDFISSVENGQLPVRFDPKKPSVSELVY